MKRRILAAVCAAGVVAGGTLAFTESPADAAPPCIIIDLSTTSLGRILCI